MPNPETVVVAARVPTDLRRDLEDLAGQDGSELSVIVRHALRAYADRRHGRAPGTLGAAGGLLDNGPAGSAHRNGTATERAAALAQAPRIGTTRRRALELIEHAGASGLTTDDVQRLFELRLSPAPPLNSTARRVTDLYQGGLIAPREVAPATHDELDAAETHGGSVIVTRATRNGAAAIVYVITAAGTRALADRRRKEQEAAGV